ncbi:MAG TPA: xanthine dehydrogenase family protein molybdopterin-binding subunit [Acidimicrobiales bacterium]|nr:xanthine dehydrogenase family protein molybdopterin-binding subunit [Acidimicrobiales bacterium]
MQNIAERYTGASVKRSEDPRILTGSGLYIDDVRLPGMLHAAFVRSPFAHARITRVDAGEARQAPGVVLVMTGAELEETIVPGPGLAGMFAGGAPVAAFSQLATDKVRLVGDPVVLVVAESRYLAEDACELVEVDYEELPAVMTAEAALDPSSPPIFEDLGGNVLVRTPVATFGDVDGAFARADRVVRARLSQHRHQNVPMECRGVVCDYDPGSEELTVYSATQGVHVSRMIMSGLLGIPVEKIRVIAGDIGGSFGLKIGGAREDIACAAAARKLGRPVRWIEDRSEHLAAAGQAREESFDVEAAVTDAGEILGLKVKMTTDTGSYPGMGAMLSEMVKGMIPGPYKIGALSFESTAIVTNKATYVAYRGPWASETWVRERLVDLIARELGLEPLDVRLLNVVTRDEPPLEMVTGRSLAGVTSRESLERIAEMVGLEDFRRRQEEARAAGRYLGLGVATYIEAAPGPLGPNESGGIMGPEQLRLRLEDDGSVTVFTSQMPHGQSHQTTIAQIAADEFGVPFDRVKVVVGDTDLVPMGFGTGGSRAATMAGGASLHGARELKAKVADVASHLFEASPEDIEIADGAVSVRGVPAKAIPLGEVAQAARQPGRLPPELAGDIEVNTAFNGGRGGWSGGTHAAVVEVDPDTGLVRVERYLVAEDCGALINPAIVEGQVRGGVAQGIGAVLLERSAYDPESGQYLSSTFMDYLLPTAVEIPRIEIEHLETVPLDDDVNFRGVGEGGMIIAPPTVCNAIEDALAPFGARVTEQHLPPTRILELIGTIEPD